MHNQLDESNLRLVHLEAIIHHVRHVRTTSKGEVHKQKLLAIGTQPSCSVISMRGFDASTEYIMTLWHVKSGELMYDCQYPLATTLSETLSSSCDIRLCNNPVKSKLRIVHKRCKIPCEQNLELVVMDLTTLMRSLGNSINTLVNR